MRLSYVIVTHNRRESLLTTLRHLHATTPLPPDHWEAWVVDNASTDGTEAAVRAEFPALNYLARSTNEGVWARSVAFQPSRGEYIILLDDDSYPIGDAVTRSLSHLEAHPECAAVVGKVVLPDGSQEGCAFPAVMLSGAVCIRRSVLLPLGGFRPEFFRKAGEYDLSYRIWQAGFRVDRFEDVVYRHDKVLTGRSKPFAHRMDLRNNLILIERYLPERLRAIYRADVTQRYAALARKDDCGWAAMQARVEGAIWRVREAISGRQTLGNAAIETLYELESQAAKVLEWATLYQPNRVIIADFSKNLYATYQACLRAGLDVAAVADDNTAFAGLSYRGIPVLGMEAALGTAPTGVVLSNVNPAQCREKAAKIKSIFRGPILTLWQPQYTAGIATRVTARAA